MKNTIGNKRSHVLAKAKSIMLKSYGLDHARMDAPQIKSVIEWLVHDFRFMHQDCVVRTVATTPTVANMTLEAGSAILECCDRRRSIPIAVSTPAQEAVQGKRHGPPAQESWEGRRAACGYCDVVCIAIMATGA